MKKRRMLFFLATVISLLITGCEKKKVCMGYAPADKEISWTDYNSVGEILDYMGCHKETLRMHYEDTVKIMGYVVPGPQGITGPFNYESHLTANGTSVTVALGDLYDVPDNKQGIVILEGFLGDTGFDNGEEMSKFQNYQYGKKVYATVICMHPAINDDDCCDCIACLPIEVEIENMEEKK